MEVERHVADCVRQVPADDGAARVTGCRDGTDVEQLAGEIVDPAEQDQRHGSRHALELADDVLGAQGRLPRPRAQPHDGFLRVIAVVTHL